jgi:hypothetical protein
VPWNLFAKSREDREAEERADREIRSQIEGISREIQLYESRSWNLYFKPRLDRILEDDMKALVGCPEDQVPVVRARIKIVRHLAELKDSLELERAELQRRRASGQEDE